METVVSSFGELGLSRSPIWALAMPATPLIGELILVNSRLTANSPPSALSWNFPGYLIKGSPFTLTVGGGPAAGMRVKLNITQLREFLKKFAAARAHR